MNEDDKSLYEQLGKAWLQYVSWREKILAGYLTALGALGYAFSKETSNPVRAGLCASSILVSIVFRILDIRTTGLVNLCQRVGRSFAAGNLYAEIDKYRFVETDKDWFLKKLKKVTSYGFAINMLVAGAIGPSLIGLVIYALKWHGDLKNRRYAQRHEGLSRFAFDPFSDIVLDPSGCWRWSGNKSEMHEYVRAYFESRKEDG